MNLFIFVAVWIALPLFLIYLGLYMLRKGKKLIELDRQAVLENRKNASALLKYLQGVDAFHAGKGANLELFPDEVVITQHKIASVSIPYSSIIEVCEQFIQKTVGTIEYDAVGTDGYSSTKITNELCLIVRHNADGKEKSIVFEKVGSVEMFTFFRQRFQEKVASHSTSKR